MNKNNKKLIYDKTANRKYIFSRKRMEYNTTWKNSKKDDLVLDYQY